MISGRIYKHKNGPWIVQVKDSQGFIINNGIFMFPDGAFRYWKQLEEKSNREEKARAIIGTINFRLLSTKDYKFAEKMFNSNCVAITKRQYGYLKGIQERNSI